MDRSERLVFDAAVVGAGSTGSTAALLLARAGLRVALLEKRSLDQAGACWVNGILPEAFDKVGIDRPRHPERMAQDGPLTMLGKTGKTRHTFMDNPLWHVDMRLLTQRLHQMARQEGVTLFEHVSIEELVFEGPRPVAMGVRMAPPQGEECSREIRARIFVDCSGLAGEMRRRVFELRRYCPAVPERHLCDAERYMYRVEDEVEAQRFLDKMGAKPGEALVWVGVAGGYSTLMVTVEHDLKNVSVLAAASRENSQFSSKDLLKGFQMDEPWVGEPVSGGGGVIPLRRPYDRLGSPGVALVGDAACHVFPVHGSGVGSGMMAAKILADRISQYADPGSTRAIWDYQSTFHRTFGCILGAYDVARRHMQAMSGDQVNGLLEAGLITRDMLECGFYQRMFKPDWVQMRDQARCAVRSPLLTLGMVPFLGRMLAVYGLYKMYPTTPSMAAFKAWSRAIGRLMGDAADISC